MNFFSKKIKIGMIIVAVIAGIGFSVNYFQESQLQTYDGPPKALIIDQLYDEMPNESLHKMAAEYFENAGYKLDIITTKDVTVDLYKKLPSMNYKYVIVRTHGAENVQDVVLFTGEKYSEDEYVNEQLFGEVKKAAPFLEVSYNFDGHDSDKWIVVNDTTRYKISSITPDIETKNEFFAIAPNLVKNGMNGKFDDTVFILGGCNTMSNPSLAKSLIDRGASAVIGWDNKVGNYDNDVALLATLSNILVKNMELTQAVESIDFILERMPYPANYIILNA